MKKYVDSWRRKIALRRAVNNFTGSGSRNMRTLSGNYPGKLRNSIEKNVRNYMLTILTYLRSKSIQTPTLYKGLKKQNANQFRRTGQFVTRSPTSTSLNRFQASTFTNYKNQVLLVIPPAKYHAMILGKHGIKSKKPREEEVILPPGTFKKLYRNRSSGNYVVNFIESGRSPPRRKSGFII
jgi:hypothetical protein